MFSMEDSIHVASADGFVRRKMIDYSNLAFVQEYMKCYYPLLHYSSIVDVTFQRIRASVARYHTMFDEERFYAQKAAITTNIHCTF